MDRPHGTITSAGSTAYNGGHLVTHLPDENQPRRRTNGHDQPCANLHFAATSARNRADKIACEQTARPANAHPAVARVDPPPIRSSGALKTGATNSTKSP